MVAIPRAWSGAGTKMIVVQVKTAMCPAIMKCTRTEPPLDGVNLFGAPRYVYAPSPLIFESNHDVVLRM